LQKCAICQDLPTLQFWSKYHYKCWKFDEKREITPKWVTGFTSKLHGRQILTCWTMLSLNCKHVQHVKIYLPCNFEVNSITYFGVITLFSSNFQHFNTFRPLFQKLLEKNVKFELQTCSACQDLPTMQFWSKSQNLMKKGK
jgi:Zn ribbon nucleic-acid-binding protein